MFKENFTGRVAHAQPSRIIRKHFVSVIFSVFIICLTGCQIFPHLPPADLSTAGWTIQQGQAVWRFKADAPEIAGEIVIATNLDGRTFVQFTKTPIPFMDGQTTAKSWQIHSLQNDKTYSGPGNPPVRALLLWVPRGLNGLPLPKKLLWRREADGSWKLKNLKSGESLEGYLNP